MEKKELIQIIGGINISGTFLNSIYKVGNMVFDIGRSLGSAIRRVVGGAMCPI